MSARYTLRARLVAILLGIVVAPCALASRAGNTSLPVDFARDVRPILASNCFQCHGPDAEVREADLRLDAWQTAGDVRGVDAAVVAGKPAESELIARIDSRDPDIQMPPPDSDRSLTPAQIETLRDWVQQGANHQRHWAYTAPQRPVVPPVVRKKWVRNPIDAFILARLEQEGLEPAAAAGDDALLRRLWLDLVGLPPALDDAPAHFNRNEDAYKIRVEQLLASPHYGERWGRVWLDVARYADSDGYEKDKPRSVWMYRDWVISALNQDMPYDEFIIEQLAGDLLPTPTQSQRVATGFLRNSMLNEEGGVDPEQFRMEAMYDRMDAVGKAMLGLTIQCAQCHSHKYDPLTHAEYFRMFAFLNNCHEAQITAYTPRQTRQWQATAGVIEQIEDDLRTESPDWRERMAEWEEQVRADRPAWTVLHPHDDHVGDEKHFIFEDGSVLAVGFAPTMHAPQFSADTTSPGITAIRLELLTDPNLPHGGPGRSIYGTAALTEFQVAAAPLDAHGPAAPLKFAGASASVNPPERELENVFDDGKGKRRVTGPIAFANDGDNDTAWCTDAGPGRSNVPQQAVFVLDKPLDATGGMRLTFTLVQNHGGSNVNDNQNFNVGRFRFALTTAEQAVADSVPADVRAILAVPAAERTVAQSARVFSHWRTTVPDWREENRRIEALWQSHPQGATQLTLIERDQPRETHRLERGNYLEPAESVTAGVPAFLHSLDSAAGAERRPTRLDFARWLADRRSPTTARAIVNRIWQAYFGVGLVATPEDLGAQGDPPSHPELLDWLAVELMDHDWSLKHIHRLIVTSATYRQSSTATPELLERDPANRLLARGPRFRVDAETVRDVALSASGLLNPRVGGPSVYPPAPDFLFKPPASFAPKAWKVDVGADRYRRGLYTFRFRSAPYPPFQTFDAPIGEVACAQRARSNTPLQALTLLNEPLFLECARALAWKVVAHGGATDAERIAYAMRRCLTRAPRAEEGASLAAFLEKQRDRFRTNVDPWPLAADDGANVGKLAAMLPAGATPADLAAWTAAARVLLSLDETITKE